MRNSQAKHVYVYGWGGAREGGCTKDLSQEKGIIWGGGQKKSMSLTITSGPGEVATYQYHYQHSVYSLQIFLLSQKY